MDMERIKQNLRIRSGRTKKTKTTAAPQVQKSDPYRDKELPHRPISQPQPPRTISAYDRDDSPSLRNWDQNTALPQMNGQRSKPVPEERQASPLRPRLTGLNSHPLNMRPKTANPPDTRPKTAKGNESTRYGRSGIERNLPQVPKHPEKTVSPSSEEDFDLRAPPSKPRSTSMDTLCEMLFSEGHLQILIHDPTLMSRFSSFLQRYKPHLSAVVLQYLEYQKAIKAIEYANAVAAGIAPIDGSKTPTQEAPGAAAEPSKYFAEASQRTYDLLVHEALPAYITYTLISLSTECLAAEIMSHSPTSLTANLIGGLSEVFCLSDPNLPDNPLIYCSEEFYRFTGYASGDVLGSNCRFLQGPKTDRSAVRRIREAVEKGEGCCETLLNYRRDGRGFVNVLIVSPLEDDKGKVKYFLGAQVDVSRLIAGGWGLEGLERLVQKQELEEIRGRRVVNGKKDQALRKLRELSEMFDVEESAVVRSHSRSSSVDRNEIGSGTVSAGASDRPKQARRVFGDDGEEGSESNGDESDTETGAETDKEKNAWKLATTGSSGKLPGIYQSYLLIRPAPSLRVIFVSPALRKKGKIGQKSFMSHLAAPAATLSGLKESFTSGIPVTAKVAFMAEPSNSKDGQPTGRWRRTNSKSKNTSGPDGADKDPSTFGRTCWISATPLLGGDDEIGVWMVVLVDKGSAPGTTLSKTKGQGMKHQQLEGRVLSISKAGERNEQIQLLSDDIKRDDVPIKPIRVGGTSVNGTPKKSKSPSPLQDREAAREMYDKDGNEAVQQEANEGSAEIVDDVTGEDHPYGTVPKADGTGEEGPPTENKPRNDDFEYQAYKDDPDLKKKTNQDISADDEDSGPGPAEEEDEDHYAVSKDEKRHQEEVTLKDTYNDNEDDENTFIRRHSQPLTPPKTKERVLIGSGSSSDVEREADIDAAANASFPGKHDADEELSTPTRTRHDHAHGDEGEGPLAATSNLRGPLDYLTHPGTRKHRKNSQDGATPSDPDCELWSPYSVD